ncbi:hypothetical protein B0H14DRAFT_2791597, partial [Mycena olivaceomarginata]
PPPELQREIFEIALRSSRRNDPVLQFAALKLKLSLLAHHIHNWVDSAFYESVWIFNDARADEFLKLVDLKPPGFFATVVKSLVMLMLLRVWGCHISVPDLSPVSNYPLRRLSVLPPFSTWPFSECLTTMLVTAPTPPRCLRTLTHLDYNAFKVTPSDLKDLLRRLPRLTHIALRSLPSPLHIEAVRATCVNLQVLMVPRPAGYLGPALADAFSDMRVARIGAAGLPDMWTRAEGIVAEQKLLWNSGRAI